MHNFRFRTQFLFIHRIEKIDKKMAKDMPIDESKNSLGEIEVISQKSNIAKLNTDSLINIFKFIIAGRGMDLQFTNF